MKAQTKQKNNSSATFKNQDHYGSAYENRSISAFSPQTSKFMEKSPERQSSRGGSCFIGTQILHDDVAESVSTMASRSTLRSIKVEPRIVAPNVSKLSAHSAVEVTLACPKGNVAVLCSVDVLKMRSLHFHDILMEQELNRQSKPPISANMMWREPIIVEEESPFEAAALLESLHEGRALFKGDWNYCWARLR